MTNVRDDRGAVAVLTAVLAVMLFGIAALVVDLGVARDSRRQAQNTADAAALAAANALYATDADNRNAPGDFDAAVAAAKEYAATNYGTKEDEWATCVNSEPLPYVHDGNSCISFDKSPYPTQALVVVPMRKQSTFFGGVFGYQGATIGALAQAQLDPGGQRICSFCVLGDGPHRLDNGDLNVVGGNVYFNGNVELNPRGIVNSESGNVVGDDGVTFSDGGNTYASGTITGGTVPNRHIGQPRIVDPLAAEILPFAAQSALVEKTGSPCGPGRGPGIYEGISSNGGECVLDPGLYVFTGDVNLGGTAELIGNGVTIYFSCGEGTDYQPCNEDTGQEGGGFQMEGGSGYQLTAPLASTHPDVDPELYGYSVVWDRYNTSVNRMRGNPDSFATGTLYGVNATLDIGGTAGTSAAFSSWVVIGGLEMNGDGELNVTFDASKNRRPSEGARGLVR